VRTGINSELGLLSNVEAIVWPDLGPTKGLCFDVRGR